MNRREMPPVRELWERMVVTIPEAVHMSGYSRGALKLLIDKKEISAFKEVSEFSESPKAGSWRISVASLRSYYETRLNETQGAG